MIVEKNKTYITSGGYVVKLDYNLCAPGMSPGQNDDYCIAGPGGWFWLKDGSIKGLTPEWMEKLKIIEECPFELPVLPEGYRWIDGFPQVRIPKRGEYFLSYDSRIKSFGEIKCCDRDYVTPYDTDGRRLILMPEVQKVTWPKYFVGECWGASDAYVQYDSPTSYFWVNRYGAASPTNTENTPLTKERLGILRWKEVTKEEALKRVVGANASHNPMDININFGRPLQFSKNVFQKEEIVMKKETAINVVTGVAKFAGKWGWRTVNYWAFEPATEVITKVMRAVRYVTLTGAIVGGVYTYNNPDKAADLIKSCLPKITVEAPEIMQG